MSHQHNESTPVINNIYGGQGGQGGQGGVGGHGGAGEGPTFNYNRVQNVTNNIGGSLVIHSDSIVKILGKWLEYPPETKDRQYHLQSLHHEDTGRWLLRDDRFIKWKATPGCLWIKGISGTGKSVLSSTVIQEITVGCPERSAVAYFYFDFRKDKQRKDIMLRSIIWQLSPRSPSPYGALHRLYKKLGNGTIQPQITHLEAVLEELLSEFVQTFIVIDALDECDKSDWKLLNQLIRILCFPNANALHLLFTSQPLDEFQEAFKDVSFIELTSEVSTPDIRAFVASEVRGIRNWASDDKHAQHVAEQIVLKSNGMFRMAACLLIELDCCIWEDDWERALTTLPADLFTIYARFVIRAKGRLPPAFIQAIFRWLLFSARQITLDELADATAFRLTDPGFDISDLTKSIYQPERRRGNRDAFKFLEGLIVIKRDGSANPSIALAHSSVKEYILSPQFQQEFSALIDLTRDVSHKFITQTCVRYLLLFADTNHLMTKYTFQKYPISLYAATYWAHHLQLCDTRDQEALLPSTMFVLEDGSRQYAALAGLWEFIMYGAWTEDKPMSPLCMCSDVGYTEGVRSLLIEHNPSIDQARKDGWTALHFASVKGNLEMVRLLMEYNASVDLASGDGRTALHLASIQGHLNVAQLLIEHHACVDQVQKDGRTALHYASLYGRFDVAQLLIEHNALVDQMEEDGRTALHFASDNGHTDIVRLLTQHKASCDQAERKGRTALHVASERGHLDIARLLIEQNATVDQAATDGNTALHIASKAGHFNIAELLIKHNASVDRVGIDGRTALHFASSKGHLDVARLLIEYHTAVDQAGTDGGTALHFASINGHLDLVQLLIEHNASVDEAEADGDTALHITSEAGHLDVAQLLIKHNASVHQPNKRGMTALHIASAKGHLNIVQLLIEHNASVDHTDTSDATPLDWARLNSHVNVVQLLIEHGVAADKYKDISFLTDSEVEQLHWN